VDDLDGPEGKGFKPHMRLQQLKCKAIMAIEEGWKGSSGERRAEAADGSPRHAKILQLRPSQAARILDRFSLRTVVFA
jgi:hypothetical protein